MNKVPILPSVVDFLTKTELLDAHFLKPAVSEQIYMLHLPDCNYSPGSEVMSVASLQLKKNDIIPVHWHSRKEKLYINGVDSCFIVWMVLKSGERKQFLLRNKDNSLIVPPQTPHAVIASYHGANISHNTMLVVGSSQDASDIIWEPAADELIKNLPRGQVE